MTSSLIIFPNSNIELQFEKPIKDVIETTQVSEPADSGIFYGQFIYILVMPYLFISLNFPIGHITYLSFICV